MIIVVAAMIHLMARYMVMEYPTMEYTNKQGDDKR